MSVICRILHFSGISAFRIGASSQTQQCSAERPCGACTSAGAQCKDWKPGDAIHEYSSTSMAPTVMFSPVSSIDDSTLVMPTSADIRESGEPAPAILQVTSLPISTASNPSDNLGHDLLWSNNVIEDFASASDLPYSTVTSPPSRLFPARRSVLSIPYDTFYRNEFGNIRMLSTSSGLAILNQLQERDEVSHLSLDDPFQFFLNLCQMDQTAFNFGDIGADPVRFPSTSSSADRALGAQSDEILPNFWDTVHSKVAPSTVFDSLRLWNEMRRLKRRIYRYPL